MRSRTHASRRPGPQPAMRITGSIRCSRGALLAGTALCATCLLVLAAPAANAQLAANAAPTGGAVVGGVASISQGGGTTAIQQSSQRAAINWQSFNVGSQQQVVFHQPGSSAIALNTVVGPNPSEIAGRITANGEVVIVNQAGVLFDKGSQVDTAGLVVSAAHINQAAFLAGKIVTDGAPRPGAAIVNNGNITIAQAGLAALVAPQVANHGLISARLGRVVLAGASGYTLDLYGDGLTAINVTSQVTMVDIGGKPVPALVTNSGTILADGGTVVLSASAVDGLIQTLVDAGGTVSAGSVGATGGRILVQGMGGGVQIDGTLAASGTDTGTTGGSVEATADGAVTVVAGARIDASGDAGGGSIALGGTTGAGTASTATVQAGALLTASATRIGAGGTVAVRSLQHTSTAGSILATGGTLGGAGGLIDIASAGSIDLGGANNARAADGTGGNLLLEQLGIHPNLTTIFSQHDINTSGSVAGTITVLDAVGNMQIGTLGGTITLDGGVSAGGGTVPTGDFVFKALTGGIDVAATITADGSDGGTQPSNIAFRALDDITVEGDISAAGVNLDFNSSAGRILQNSGTIAAHLLTGSAADGVTLNDNNVVDQLGSFSAGGHFSLVDTSALEVTDTVSSGASGLALVLQAPTITLSNNAGLIAASGTMSLDATSGSLGGTTLTTLTADTLSATAGGGAVTLIGDDNIGTLDAGSSHNANFTVLTGGSLTVTGLVSAGTGNISLLSNNLTIAASGSLSTSGVAFLDANQIDTAGSVTAGQVWLSRATPGVLTVGTATTSVNAADLANVNTGTLVIGSENGTSADSNVTSLVIAKPLIATGETLGLFSSGALTQSNTIDAKQLFGTAGSATLTLGNTINALGDFTTTNDFSLTVAGSLSLTGTLSAGGNAALTGTGTGSAVTIGTAGSLGAATALLQADQIDTKGTVDAATVFLARDSAGAMVVGNNSSNLVAADLTNIIATTLVIGSPDGSLAHATAQSLTLNGTIESQGSAAALQLYSTGSIAGSGILATPTLTGAAGGTVSLGNANLIDTLGTFSAVGFALNDASPLTVDDAVTVTGNGPLALSAATLTLTNASILQDHGGIITLASDNLVRANGGTIDAGPTTGAGTVVLDRITMGTLGLHVADLANLTAGTLDLGSPGGTLVTDITLFGTPDLTGHVMALGLYGSGAATANNPITVNTLTGHTGSADFSGTDAIGTLAGFIVDTGSFTLDDSGSALSVTGAVKALAGDVTLTADSLTLSSVINAGGLIDLVANTGTIGAAGAALTAGTLTGSADGTASFTGANAIGTLAGFTVSTGSFSLADTGTDLSVTAPVQAPMGGITLTADSITATDTLAALNTVSLVAAAGTIDSSAGITAASLTGSATSDAMFTGANAIGTLAGFVSTNGSLTLLDMGHDLTLSGTVKAAHGDVSLTARTLTIGGALTAGNTLSLVAGTGTIAASGVSAGTLVGSAGTDATFTGTNSITTLGSFTTGGVFTLIDATPLTVAGTLSAPGTVTLSSTDPAGITIDATGAIEGDAGVLLRADAIATGGTITSDGTVYFTRASSGTLTIGDTGIAGFVDAAALVLGSTDGTTPDPLVTALAIDGTLTTNSGVALGLFSAGAITEGSQGLLTTGTLFGSAMGGVSLTGLNDIGTVAGFGAGGTFALTDAAGGTLTITDDITSGTSTGLALIASAITLLSGVTLASTGGTIDLTADMLDLGGHVTTGGTATGFIGITDLTSGTLTLDAARLFHLTTGTLSLGSLNGVSPSNTVHDITVNGSLDLSNNTNQLDLFTTQSGTVTTDGLTVQTLSGSTGTAIMGGPNTIGTLAGFTAATGPLSLVDTGPLVLTGTISGQGGVTLSADGITQVANSLLVATGGDIDLTSSTTIDFLGTIQAGTLSAGAYTGTAALVAQNGDVTEHPNALLLAGTLAGAADNGVFGIAQGNSIATLGSFTTAGNLTLEDDTGITLAGPLSVGGSLTLSGSGGGGVSGDLVLTGNVSIGTGVTLVSGDGIIQRGGLLQSGSGVSLTAANGILQEQGAAMIAHGGTLSLMAGGHGTTTDGTLSTSGILFAGTLAGAFLSLDAGTNSLTELASGQLQGGTLTGHAGAADLSVAQGNSIASFGSFSATSLTLEDDIGLILAGPVVIANNLAIDLTGGNGPGGRLTLAGTIAVGGTATLVANGDIVEQGGSFSASFLTGQAADAVFDQSTTVQTLGSFTTAGSFTLLDTSALTVSGPLSAGSDVTLQAAANRDLTLAAGIHAGGTIGLSGAGIIQSAGIARAATGLTANAANGIVQAAGAAFITDAGTLALTAAGSAATGLGGLSTTGVLFAGTLSAPSLVVTARAGDFTERAVGVLDVGTLAGKAGAVSLAVAQGNTITTIGSFTAGGSLALEDDTGLTITGPLSTGGAFSLVGAAGAGIGGDLVLNGNLTVGGPASLVVGGDITQQGGTFTATSLTGSAGTVSLDAASGNSIAMLGSFTASGGFSLMDAIGLTLAGPLSAGGNLVLSGPGGGVGGTLTLAGNATAGGHATLAATRGIVQQSGTIEAASDLTLTAGDGIIEAPSGALLADAGTLSLTAGGGAQTTYGTIATTGIAFAGLLSGPVTDLDAGTNDLTELNTGLLTAGTLTGQAGTASLTVTQGNTIGTLGSFTTTSDLIVEDDTGLTLAGPLSVGGTLDIHGPHGGGIGGDLVITATIEAAHGDIGFNALGGIVQAGGTIEAAHNLSLTAGDGILQTAGGVLMADAGTLALSAAGGSVTQYGTLSSSGILFDGTLNAPTVQLLAPGEELTEQQDGLLQAGTLSGTGTTISLAPAGGNRIAALGSLAATTGDVTLEDDTGLAIQGPLTAAGNITIAGPGGAGIGGDLSIANTVSAATGTIALAAAGSILQTAGTMAALSGITLTAGNGILQQAGGAIDAGGTLLLAAGGTLAAVPDNASTNAVDFAGLLSAPSIDIEAQAGNVTEEATGQLNTALLTGQSQAASLSVAQGNTVATLGSYTAGADFTLEDDTGLAITGPLTVNGNLAIGGPGTLGIGGALLLSGVVTVGNGTVSLSSAQDIDEQAGGVLIARALAGSAAAVSLDVASGNQIGTLAGFTTTGSFALEDDVGLTLTGPLVASTLVSIHGPGGGGIGGALLLGADLTAPGAVVSLQATGAISQTAGTLAAGTLTGSAASLLLPSTGNQIGTLGPFASTGDLMVQDGAALTVASLVSAGGTLSLATPFLSLTGTLAAPDVQLTAGTITALTSSAIQAGLLQVASSGEVLLNGFNRVGTLGNVTAADFGFTDEQDLAVAGTLTVPGTIDWFVLGNLTETGTILAGTVTGSAANAFLATGGNRIGTLADFSTGTLDFATAGTLNVAGTLTATDASLTANGLQIPGSIASNTLTLASAGGITAPGVITASLFTGSAGGSASFTGLNSIATLGGFTAPTGFTLRDDAPLTVTGGVSASAGSIAITAGALTVQAAMTALNMLDLEAGSGAIATSAGTDLSSGRGALQLQAAQGIDIEGSALAATTLHLAAGGNITTGAAALLQAGTGAGSILIEAPGTIALGGTLMGATTQIGSPTGNTVTLGTPTGAVQMAVGAPQEVDWNGTVIETGSSVPAGTPKPIFPVSNGTLSGNAAGLYVYTQRLDQGGVTTINPDGAPSTVTISLLPGTQAITFNNLDAPTTNLFINLGDGTVNGSITLAGLNVSYTPPGSPSISNLSGLIDGLGGQAAAGSVYVVPTPNPNLRINACAFASVACILLSPILVPVVNPVEDVIVEAPRRKREDDDLIIPNVAEQDF